MNRQTVNDAFTLEIPDRFEVLTEADLRGMYRDVGDPFKWGVRDAKNHVILLALWKQYSLLLSWALDLKAIVKKNEQLTARTHAAHGYRFLEFLSVQAGDEKAEGYCFAYDKDGITQFCTNLLIKGVRTIYAFICVGREENRAADRSAFCQIMETLKHA